MHEMREFNNHWDAKSPTSQRLFSGREKAIRLKGDASEEPRWAWGSPPASQNSAIILVLGDLRSIYLEGSLNFRAPPHQTSPKI